MSKDADTRQEDVFQAVILADPFGAESRWGPLYTHDKPWCLLPLLNTPIIGWTLECLAASGVQQVYIIAKEHQKQIQAWIDSSTFGSPLSPMSIVLQGAAAYSEGDAIRAVDELPLKGNFLLVRAGYIGNLDLRAAIDQFAVKAKKDKGLIMDSIVTTLKGKKSPVYSVSLLGEANRILYYDSGPRYPKRKRVRVPSELLEDGKLNGQRDDLCPVGVEICSEEVPPLFVENFDYQSLRPDFINGVLTSDVLGKTMCNTLIDELPKLDSKRTKDWAILVDDLGSYETASAALLSRWMHPLVPDEIIPGSTLRYHLRKSRLYIGRRVEADESCIIDAASLIGPHSNIGADTYIENSVIGEFNRISSSCEILNSFIFEGVIIDSDCIIRNSIIGPGVRIGAGSVIEDNSIIGEGVVIGEGAMVRGVRVAAAPWDGEMTGSISLPKVNMGAGAQGYPWPSEEDVRAIEDADEDEPYDARNLRLSKLGGGDSSEDESGWSSASEASASSLSRSSSSNSLHSQFSETSSKFEGGAGIRNISSLQPESSISDKAFVKECVSSLDRAFSEDHTVENASIELKTLRMATNVPMRQVLGVVIPYLCNQLSDVPLDAPAPMVLARSTKLLERWGDLINGLTAGQDASMVDTLLSLQSHCASAVCHPRLFSTFMQIMYNEDIVSEDSLVTWVKNPKARDVKGDPEKKLWSTGMAFVKAIMEAEDSDEDSDE